MPILSMLEWIRRKLIKCIHIKYTGMLKHAISSVPSQQEWKKIRLNDIYPPIPRKPAGNLRKNEFEVRTNQKTLIGFRELVGRLFVVIMAKLDIISEGAKLPLLVRQHGKKG